MSRCTPRNSPASYRPAPAPRGVATIAVIITMVLLAAAFTSLMLLFATEARRTRSTIAGAQLRQLLLAAAPVAQEELQLHGSTPRDVRIPTPVTGATLSVHISPLAPDKASIRVTAKMYDGVAAQTLDCLKTGKTWHVQSATLSAEP